MQPTAPNKDLEVIKQMQKGEKASVAFGQPLYFQESNTFYPAKYNIYVDETNPQLHHVTLSDFVLR